MVLFVISLIPLFAAPLLVRAMQATRWGTQALDAFILVSVGGIVFLHILPDAFVHGGVLALAAMVAGLLMPFLSERFYRRGEERAHRAALILALLALAVHAALDGVAFAAFDVGTEGGGVLAAAVLLHRLPAGLAIWWLVRPKFGFQGAAVTVGTIALASAAGFIVSLNVPRIFEADAWYVIQSLLAGTLVHIILHQSMGPAALNGNARWQPASAVGGILAVGALVALSLSHLQQSHPSLGLDVGRTFFTLAVQIAPPILLAYLLAAVLHTQPLERLLAWFHGGSTSSQALRGTVLGLPMNVCSCAVATTYTSMIRRGIPPAAAMAFLVAAPEIGIATVLLTFKLLGVQVGVARAVLAVLLGLLVGLWLGRQASRPVSQPEPSPLESQRPVPSRIGQAVAFGFGEVADQTLPWLLVGMGIASLIEPLVSPEQIAAVPEYLQVPVMAAIGAPLFVCATGSTPLAAVLMHKGIAPGAAIAFLITGSVTNSTTWGVLSRLHGRKVAFAYSAGVGGIAILFGYLLDAALGGDFRVPLHQMAQDAPSLVELSCLVIIALLTVVTLFRQGVPGFVSRVLVLHGHHHDHHDHHDHHHH